MAGAEQAFRFAQFEYPWPLGPPAGRYVLREPGASAPARVLVLATLGAPERRLLRGRRPRAAEAEPGPAPVTTTRATLIDAAPVPAGDAAAWLAGLDAPGAAAALGDALRALNAALHAHAVAAEDARVREADHESALVARVGWGRGEQVAEGRWAEARELPFRAARRRRAETLRPQERLAAILGGRDHPLPAEALALRARSDLRQGRPREAALQLRVALEAAIADLERADGSLGLGERLAQLREQRASVGEAANRALAGDLPVETVASVEDSLARVEAALRVRGLAVLDEVQSRAGA